MKKTLLCYEVIATIKSETAVTSEQIFAAIKAQNQVKSANQAKVDKYVAELIDLGLAVNEQGKVHFKPDVSNLTFQDLRALYNDRWYSSRAVPSAAKEPKAPKVKKKAKESLQPDEINLDTQPS